MWVCLLTFNGERLPHSEQFAVGIDRDLKVQQGFVHDERVQGRRICPSPWTHKHHKSETGMLNRQLTSKFPEFTPHLPKTCAGTLYLGLPSCNAVYTEDGITCILIHCVNTYIITWTSSLCGWLIRHETHCPSISYSCNIDPIDPYWPLIINRSSACNLCRWPRLAGDTFQDTEHNTLNLSRIPAYITTLIK